MDDKNMDIMREGAKREAERREAERCERERRERERRNMDDGCDTDDRHDPDRKNMMKKIQEYGFALMDAMLFLDTHPCNLKALDYFKKYRKLYDDTVLEYSKKYGPITAKDGIYNDRWTWVDGPWPWENEVTM